MRNILCCLMIVLFPVTALAVDRTEAQKYYDLGMSYLMSELYEQGLETLNQVAFLYPDSDVADDALYQLALIREDVGDGKVKIAKLQSLELEVELVERASKRTAAVADISAGKKISAEFDTVKVRHLQVVDDAGKVRALMSISNSHSGVLELYGNDDKIGALIGGGGIVCVRRNDDTRAAMYVHDCGGFIDIFGNDGKRKAAIGVNEYGHGAVNTWDKNGYRLR